VNDATDTAAEIIARLAARHNITTLSPGLRRYVRRKVGDGWSFARIEKGAKRAGILKNYDWATEHFSFGPSQS